MIPVVADRRCEPVRSRRRMAPAVALTDRVRRDLDRKVSGRFGARMRRAGRRRSEPVPQPRGGGCQDLHANPLLRRGPSTHPRGSSSFTEPPVVEGRRTPAYDGRARRLRRRTPGRPVPSRFRAVPGSRTDHGRLHRVDGSPASATTRRPSGTRDVTLGVVVSSEAEIGRARV